MNKHEYTVACKYSTSSNIIIMSIYIDMSSADILPTRRTLAIDEVRIHQLSIPDGISQLVQTYLRYIHTYMRHCNRLLADTVMQEGKEAHRQAGSCYYKLTFTELYFGKLREKKQVRAMGR